MDRSQFPALARLYRKRLFEDVMPFWEKHSPDRVHGGYLHSFDRKGGVLDTNKNMWCQGRMTYMMAALYNQMGKDRKWLALAKLGRDFMVKHAYAGNGRWRYLLDQKGGRVTAGPSFFTDSFVLLGLCEYAVASGSDEDLPLIRATYDALERNLTLPGFNEFHHFDLNPNHRWHSPHMIMVGLAETIRPVLGDKRIDATIARCLHDVLYTFAKDEHRLLFEVVNADGSVLKTDAGQTINPGHALESMWFCLEESLRRGDKKSGPRHPDHRLGLRQRPRQAIRRHLYLHQPRRRRTAQQRPQPLGPGVGLQNLVGAFRSRLFPRSGGDSIRQPGTLQAVQRPQRLHPARFPRSQVRRVVRSPQPRWQARVRG